MHGLVEQQFTGLEPQKSMDTWTLKEDDYRHDIPFGESRHGIIFRAYLETFG